MLQQEAFSSNTVGFLGLQRAGSLFGHSTVRLLSNRGYCPIFYAHFETSISIFVNGRNVGKRKPGGGKMQF